ncbi:MAG TPA: chemotaxis protein CheW [Polyangiaceae bacterium]|jgi:purine-binding chemotaxis protein CheW
MCVSVGSSSYGLPLENVQEVIGVRAVTRVFHAPPALAGIINLRGEVLPILDLPVLLGSEAEDAKLSDARIVVVREQAGLKRRAGLRVDALLGLLDVPLSGLTAVPSSIAPAIRNLVVGVIPTSPPCAVLVVASLLGAPELASLAGVSA